MLILEIVLYIALGYVLLLLLLEGVIWKTQPDMEGGVTLHINVGNEIVQRKLFGLELDNKLYVSSNHWFRGWYHAVLQDPDIHVERDGKTQSYLAIPVEPHERTEIAKHYDMGFGLRLLCGFAPQRFLRLELLPSQNDSN